MMDSQLKTAAITLLCFLLFFIFVDGGRCLFTVQDGERDGGRGGGAGGSFWARHMSKTRRLLHDIILQTERRTTAFVNQLNLSELIRNCRFIVAAVFAAVVALLSRFMHRYEPLLFFLCVSS